MAENKISFQALKDTLKKFNKLKVHVVGDTIIDTYTRTSFIGGQTKHQPLASYMISIMIM